MFEPEPERNRLLQQQPGVLVFAAAVETAQHQEKIDNIGIGAGPAYFQFDVIQFELPQLQLQLGQIRSLASQASAGLTALAKPCSLLGRDSGFIGSRVEETEARINRKYRNSRRSL
jgi:hypothetical protein